MAKHAGPGAVDEHGCLPGDGVRRRHRRLCRARGERAEPLRVGPLDRVDRQPERTGSRSSRSRFARAGRLSVPRVLRELSAVGAPTASCWTAPPAVSFTSHAATAVDVRDTPDGLQEVVLDSGETLGDLQAVVLALGHMPHRLGEPEMALSQFADRHGLRYIATEQPGRRAAGRHTRGRIGDLARPWASTSSTTWRCSPSAAAASSCASPTAP